MNTSLAFFKRTGLIAGLGFPLIILLTGLLTPNYSHINQYISELGAVDAPFRNLMNWLGIAPFGALVCIFSAAMIQSLRPGITIWIAGSFLLISGMGFLTAGIFNCDAGCSFQSMSQSQIIHNLSAMGGFVAAIIAAGVFSLKLITKPKLQKSHDVLYWTSLIAFILMLASFTSMFYAGPNSSIIGLLQRCFILSLCVWLSLSSRYLLKLD